MRFIMATLFFFRYFGTIYNQSSDSNHFTLFQIFQNFFRAYRLSFEKKTGSLLKQMSLRFRKRYLYNYQQTHTYITKHLKTNTLHSRGGGIVRGCASNQWRHRSSATQPLVFIHTHPVSSWDSSAMRGFCNRIRVNYLSPQQTLND